MFRLILTFFLIAAIGPAWADPQPAPAPKGDFKRLTLSGVGIVAQAIDGQTLSLKDGRIVRLAGLEIPDVFSENPSNVAIAAKTILNDTLKNREIRIYIVKDKNWQQSRYGYVLAQIEDKITGAWMQGVLVANGLARVEPTFPLGDSLKILLAAEQKARDNKRGLWGDPLYVIRTPENIEADIGTTQIIEGTIKSAATVKNIIYLNFGDNWRKDFTVVIPSDQRRALAKKNISPLSLTGQKIRVRGMVIDQNGPALLISSSDQIEVLP